MLNDVVCYELNILQVLNTRTQFPKLILQCVALQQQIINCIECTFMFMF